mmetsp:Transcript_11323/g.36008  ORF Transcript_11323/g.36008 Transcript_11323/m.36008 type:complete len:214 (+) Transcript_11323:300-941(+)
MPLARTIGPISLAVVPALGKLHRCDAALLPVEWVGHVVVAEGEGGDEVCALVVEGHRNHAAGVGLLHQPHEPLHVLLAVALLPLLQPRQLGRPQAPDGRAHAGGLEERSLEAPLEQAARLSLLDHFVDRGQNSRTCLRLVGDDNINDSTPCFLTELQERLLRLLAPGARPEGHKHVHLILRDVDGRRPGHRRRRRDGRRGGSRSHQAHGSDLW